LLDLSYKNIAAAISEDGANILKRYCWLW